MAKVSVIGSGGWGTAVAIMLAENGHEVVLWSYFKEESENLERNRENIPFLPGIKIPDSVAFTAEIAACADADLIITASPSHAMRNTARALAPVVRPGQLILNISKGLEEESFYTLSQVLREELPDCEIAVMSGPSHAEEVSRAGSHHQRGGGGIREDSQFDSGYHDEPQFSSLYQPGCLGRGAGRFLEKCHCPVRRDSGRHGAGRQYQGRADDPRHCGDVPAGRCHGGQGGDLQRAFGHRRPHCHLYQYALQKPPRRDFDRARENPWRRPRPR